MGGKSLQLKNVRWKRWAAVTTASLAVYSIAGFWLIPLVVKTQVPKFGQAELARQATVGEVRFNPYTLRLEVQHLRLAEADGTPLFAVDKLAVDLDWTSLFRRAWSFAEIRVSSPSAHLEIAPDGTFNVAELLASFKRDDKEPPSGLPRLVIDRFVLEQGKVDVRDRRAGYANQFAPIDFALSNISTLLDENGSYTFSAHSARGGTLRWKGEASLSPIRGSGELVLENASLPELAAYLKPYTQAKVTAGQLSITLPYRFSYNDGKFDASLAGARLALRDLALAHKSGASFAKLKRLDVIGIGAELARREATVSELHVSGGALTVRRNAKGELDLARLMAPASTPAPPPSHPGAASNWKLALKRVVFDQVALSAVDETVSPPLRLSADKLRLQLQLSAGQAGANFGLKAADAEFSLADVALTSGSATPFKLGQLGFTGGAFDLSERRVSFDRLYADAGELQLTRNLKGQLDILDLLPKSRTGGSQAPAPAGAPWVAAAHSVELSKFGADIKDQGTGVKVRLQDVGVKLKDASSDLARPLRFDGSMTLREGGQLAAQGEVVPATSALAADVRVTGLALAPLQPLLSQHLKLKIAGGSVSAQGRLTTGETRAKRTNLRYVGSFGVDGLALDEEDGERFAAWKSLRADTLTASLGPNRLDIPVLNAVEPTAILHIEDDRTFNAARLLVRPVASAPPAPAAAPSEPFPVRVGRLRLQNAKLDFTDLSLRPQFSAKIYELNGVVNGLSSVGDTRSAIALDGRVDAFGMARIRGRLNPFAPRENTDINVVFKNVDMVPTSPYSMKFAGYKVAGGSMSLDLKYKVRDSQLEGANRIVIDKLTLGERVDSPDALKLPLTLAIAILKDSDGRIDLGLPVTGNMNDPQFSYGALVWKAVGNVLDKIVTAPFRSLGSLLGISGDKLESIDFDPGSDRLLPPEREKLDRVAQMLSRRAQLQVSVPGQYSEAADGAALKARALRAAIATRAGIKLAAGEDTGPLQLDDRAVRAALRSLYAERFGPAELEQAKKAAEAAAGSPAAQPGAPGIQTEGANGKLPLLQRVGKLIQGEPQVADASAFYRKLRERLEQNQPLPADSLPKLGAQRASAVLAALKDAGADPASMRAGEPANVNSEARKPVPLTLGLAAK